MRLSELVSAEMSAGAWHRGSIMEVFVVVMILDGDQARASPIPFTPAWLKAPCPWGSWAQQSTLRFSTHRSLWEGLEEDHNVGLTAQSGTDDPWVSNTPSPT